MFFYATEEDANNDQNAITVADSLGTYWIRGVTADDCEDLISVELIDATPEFLNIIGRAACDSFDLSEITPITANTDPAQFLSLIHI